MGKCFAVGIGTTHVIGLAMTVTGVVILVLVFPGILDSKLKEQLPIQNGTDTMDRFVESPVPMFMKFYVFNVTNPDEVNNVNGTIPNLKELGPYVFRQSKNKTVLEVDELLGTIRYTEYTVYHYEESASKGSLDDVVYHVNVLAAAAGGALQPLKELVLSNTVDDLLFKGTDVTNVVPDIVKPICDMFIPKCVLAALHQGNNTDSKEYLVSTGTLSLKNIGNIISYDKKRELPYWMGKYCNAINGTDGKQFSPGVTKDDELYVFSADICRSLKIKYEKDVTIQGIDALRFVVPEIVFADPNIHKDNMCFCTEPVNGTCPSKAGVVPLNKCLKNPGESIEKPIMASSPHFYYAEQEYYNKFKGLNRNKAQHETYLDIEPLTGTVISAAKRIQVNVLIRPLEGQPFVQFVTEPFYFPVYWAEEGGVIDDNSAREFREKVTNPYKTGKWSLVAVIVVGGLLILLTWVAVFIKRGKSKSGGKQRV